MSPAKTLKLNERQRNEQPIVFRINERLNTTQPNKQMVESADRHSPPKQQKGV